MKHNRCFFTGFTLIEMIMVITITGIIAAAVAVFIRAPVQGYVDSVRRAELTDQADVALRRISRDVRRALPNSVRSVTNGFEFVMTKSGGRYRDDADGSTGGNPLRFTSDINPCGNNLCFDVLGTMPALQANDYIVVHNLTTNDIPALTDGNAYVGDNRALVSAIAGNTVTLSSNPFAIQSPPLRSPSARFQVVDRNEQVVRYTCDGTSLTRATLCSLGAAGCTANSGLLAGGGATTAVCTIDYTSAALGSNGLLYISLTLTDTPSGESVSLFQEILVNNAP